MNPRLDPVTFFPKYLTGCISHCCIIGGLTVTDTLNKKYLQFLISYHRLGLGCSTNSHEKL